MAQVHVVMGSASDKEAIAAAKVIPTLKEIGISCEVTVCSAHRNLPELEAFAAKAVEGGAQVFIAVAGMAAALPGALAGCTGMNIPIIGVPLDEHGIDSCIYMPPGVPVLAAGVGKTGLKNGAIAAAQIVAVGDATAANSLKDYIAKNNKQPQYNVDLEASA